MNENNLINYQLIEKTNIKTPPLFPKLKKVLNIKTTKNQKKMLFIKNILNKKFLLVKVEVYILIMIITIKYKNSFLLTITYVLNKIQRLWNQNLKRYIYDRKN